MPLSFANTYGASGIPLYFRHGSGFCKTVIIDETLNGSPDEYLLNFEIVRAPQSQDTTAEQSSNKPVY